MEINGGEIHVDICETYEGSQHYRVRIHLPGFGLNHPGFVMVNVEELKREHGEYWGDLLGDTTMRPEYARAIKSALES